MVRINIILLLIFLCISSHSTEIDIIASGITKRNEKVLLKENMNIKNLLCDANLKSGSGIVLYYDKKEVIKEEVYDKAKFKNYYTTVYTREKIDEESKILSGTQKNIEYYNYNRKKVKKITIYFGEYKIFEIKINENGEIQNIIEGECKNFISVGYKENCRKQYLY